MQGEGSEAQTRTELIDIQPARAGWSKSRRSLVEEFGLGVAEPEGEYQGQEYADYVLLGADGKPIAVVEAKSTSRDELAGKRQAADYADTIKTRFGEDPFIFLTNGKEIQFRDRERYPPRRVAGFYTRDDLERLQRQRLYAQPLDQLLINQEIAGRDYQNEAVRRVTEGIHEAKRKFLLVMATGTGKTRTAIALADLLLRARRVQRVLFLADRRALVRQAMAEFTAYLPSESLARIESGETSGARIQFSTYPSMMQVYRRLSVGHFDLVIADESHRSIYQQKTNPAHLINVVFPWLRELDRHFTPDAADGTELASLDKRMEDAYFQLDPKKGQVLSDAIDTIDQLFVRAGEGSAAQDIMGDTFEYLLSEVATAGKNGQFRTPRHIIRFMLELLGPEPGSRIIDPAAGTGGFLFGAQQYLLREKTPKENLRLEWDGTPHRLDGAAATEAQYNAIHNGANFIGLDNDRTMARIGWMNLVLNDIANPHLLQGDSLSKREGKDPRQRQLLEPEQYDFVLANPPFTGTVDSNDLEPDVVLFPRVGGRGKKKGEAITNKSELLFLWLMLDLLRVGGRCAVIVPEGVLFGNTEAHIRLRRELLTEHCVEAVISLPGGVFQPYTGVKTSILVFRKETLRDGKQTFTGAKEPVTRRVWFYEVEQDGFSLDAKRNPRPGQRNDLWDALEKFRLWMKSGPDGARENAKTLLQPSFRQERWRQATLRDSADKLTPAGEAFADQTDTGAWDGRIWAIHELFEDLPSDPKEAEARQLDEAGAALYDLILRQFAAAQPIRTRRKPAHETGKPMTGEAAPEAWQKAIAAPRQEFNRVARDLQRRFFEPEGAPALPLWKELVKDRLETALSVLEGWVTRPPEDGLPPWSQPEDLNQELAVVAREIAKLDGFDVTLRSLAVDQVSELDAVKNWVVPVRAWAQNDDWHSENGQLQGSHDSGGQVRDAYVQAMLAEGLYDDKGKRKGDLLDPDCIEARDWNLSAGQYKPFDFSRLKSDKSVADLIGELKATEQQIISGLDRLLAIVEGHE